MMIWLIIIPIMNQTTRCIKMIRMCLYLSEDRKQKLQDIAKKEEMSLNALINKILKEFVEKRK